MYRHTAVFGAVCVHDPVSILHLLEHKTYRPGLGPLRHPLNQHTSMASSPRTIELPASVLADLHRGLASEVGEVEAVRALQRSGFRAGEAFWAELERRWGAGLRDSSLPQFWERVSEFFDESGFGRLEFDGTHEAVGLVRADGWAESVVEADSGLASGESAVPGCAFTCGVLSRMLTSVAGAPVAVLEVECRSAGGSCCTFAFGTEETMTIVHERLRVGQDWREVLTALA